MTLRCKTALSGRLRELRPDCAWLKGFRGYLAHLEDNFLPEITPELYHGDYMSGAGSELLWSVRNGRRCPPKMQAAHSSSALVVNSFALWKRHLSELDLGGRLGFSCLRFERKVPTPLGGTPPHLDFLAEALDGARVVAAESKATEFLQGHRAVFAPSYDSVTWPKSVEGYVAVMLHLQSTPSAFVYLDAGQLVKHAFGLATNFVGRDTLLLYLFWEPENRDSYPEFDQHREEVQRFASWVTGSSVKFLWMSYSRLWHEWADRGVLWLRQHAERLRERYIVRI